MRRPAMISFLASAALAAAAPALAQTSDKVWRLGVLSPGSLEYFRETILPELAKQGFVEGRNLVVEMRGRAPDKLPELARELLATQPDAVVAVGSFAIRAVRQASSTIPIIGANIGEDPIAAGFATSLARPGGNVTGIEMLAPELDAKRLDLVHQAVPGAHRVAALAVTAQRQAPHLAAVKKAAALTELELLTFDAATPAEYPRVFAAMRAAGVEALAILSAPEFANNAEALAALALGSRLPTVCEWARMAEQGCLLGYGPDQAELRRRTADYVARIFRGAVPGELPIEEPTHYRFAVNLKTARALGLTISPAILARADEVIE
jgi:putative tryptophan/tyrosine transport system substrate-binding protein